MSNFSEIISRLEFLKDKGKEWNLNYDSDVLKILQDFTNALNEKNTKIMEKMNNALRQINELEVEVENDFICLNHLGMTKFIYNRIDEQEKPLLGCEEFKSKIEASSLLENEIDERINKSLDDFDRFFTLQKSKGLSELNHPQTLVQPEDLFSDYRVPYVIGSPNFNDDVSFNTHQRRLRQTPKETPPPSQTLPTPSSLKKEQKLPLIPDKSLTISESHENFNSPKPLSQQIPKSKSESGSKKTLSSLFETEDIDDIFTVPKKQASKPKINHSTIVKIKSEEDGAPHAAESSTLASIIPELKETLMNENSQTSKPASKTASSIFDDSSDEDTSLFIFPSKTINKKPIQNIQQSPQPSNQTSIKHPLTISEPEKPLIQESSPLEAQSKIDSSKDKPIKQLPLSSESLKGGELFFDDDLSDELIFSPTKPSSSVLKEQNKVVTKIEPISLKNEDGNKEAVVKDFDSRNEKKDLTITTDFSKKPLKDTLFTSDSDDDNFLARVIAKQPLESRIEAESPKKTNNPPSKTDTKKPGKLNLNDILDLSNSDEDEDFLLPKKNTSTAERQGYSEIHTPSETLIPPPSIDKAESISDPTAQISNGKSSPLSYVVTFHEKPESSLSLSDSSTKISQSKQSSVHESAVEVSDSSVEPTSKDTSEMQSNQEKSSAAASSQDVSSMKPNLHKSEENTGSSNSSIYASHQVQEQSIEPIDSQLTSSKDDFSKSSFQAERDNEEEFGSPPNAAPEKKSQDYAPKTITESSEDVQKNNDLPSHHDLDESLESVISKTSAESSQVKETKFARELIATPEDPYQESSLEVSQISFKGNSGEKLDFSPSSAEPTDASFETINTLDTTAQSREEIITPSLISIQGSAENKSVPASEESNLEESTEINEEEKKKFSRPASSKIAGLAGKLGPINLAGFGGGPPPKKLFKKAATSDGPKVSNLDESEKDEGSSDRMVSRSKSTLVHATKNRAPRANRTRPPSVHFLKQMKEASLDGNTDTSTISEEGKHMPTPEDTFSVNKSLDDVKVIPEEIKTTDDSKIPEKDEYQSESRETFIDHFEKNKINISEKNLSDAPES